MSSSDDDELRLSAEAVEALKEFYEEKLGSRCDDEKDVKEVNFDEDWVGRF